ncbi:MAG: bifunctional 3-demethylubiquinol 3-O-methyltransferase/2-polyprenyl-6-hydroxyphenol methylase [Gammaproteobacteria bacterium]|jgi:2-polyprenyl-6-hydroxyphenyl methylase/3-demethylubiquinone-9 3-methyltransferase|nr:bifunctional 3-demethylubiquinol 3-O-methyltransferase/2-polyprenyl-6-hydroxyphenol methylase [Gammaproteobacteria bacterium]
MNNIDQAEIEKFSSLAYKWWDKEGEFKTLHEINPLRMQFIQQHAVLNGQNVLDIGCGGGILSESMAQAGATVTGIDLAGPALEIAKLHLLESKLKVDYHCISAETFAEQHPGEFDVITCMEMLEHVPNPESIIAACSKLVKPGGHVFFSTLNRNVKSFLMAIVGAEYILGLVPKGTHQYEKFIRPSELIQAARVQGLKVEASAGIDYHPFRKPHKLGQNLDVNYILCTVKA